MDNIKILDCTLRDGGYINDWNFGHNTLVNIFDHVTSAGIEFIEVGFLDARQPFNVNRSIGPNTQAMNKIYGKLNKKSTLVVGMIDYGTCPIENLQPQKTSFLDGIRVIFKKHLRNDALQFCKEIKKLGYKVFAQAVSITSYNDEELLDLIRLANDVHPFALSIVDTYGLLHKKDLFHYYEMMNRNLIPEIGIGYHAHNNFQLGYANCIELMNLHGDNDRMLLCDGSVFGMGKGAGNAPTELLSMYLNENMGANYDISHLLEAIDVSILDIYNTARWGYQLKFFIAASNDCHPNYVAYLLDKKTLSVKSINDILKKIDEEKKLMFDKLYVEDLYVQYQTNEYNDAEAFLCLRKDFEGKEILLLGPGKSIEEEADRITSFIDKNAPKVIAINFLPEHLSPQYVFFSNAKRYVQQMTNLNEKYKDIITLATSNVTRAEGKFNYVFDYASLIDKGAVTPDNSFIMLLKILCKLGVSKIYCAGLDGYSSDNSENYYLTKMEYEFVKHIWEQINSYVNTQLSFFNDSLNIHFITSTKYEIAK